MLVGGTGVLVGCGTDVLVGWGADVLVGWGIGVLVGWGMRVFVGCGIDVLVDCGTRVLVEGMAVLVDGITVFVAIIRVSVGGSAGIVTAVGISEISTPSIASALMPNIQPRIFFSVSILYQRPSLFVAKTRTIVPCGNVASKSYSVPGPLYTLTSLSSISI